MQLFEKFITEYSKEILNSESKMTFWCGSDPQQDGFKLLENLGTTSFKMKDHQKHIIRKYFINKINKENSKKSYLA